MAKKKGEKRDPFMSYKQKDYDYERMMIKSYYTNDVKFTVIIFRVNGGSTQTTGNIRYMGESRSRAKSFHEPVELTARIKAGSASFKFIAGSGVQKQEYDDFSFNLFLSDLEDKNISIKAGDFVLFNDGDQKRFFEIKTITTLNTGNGGHGYKPVFNKVTAALRTDASIPNDLKNS